ncbi:MAG: MBL fold metallo-hydrolase [Patescibacteria group bacterium]
MHMIVTYHGNQFFKLQFGDMVVAVNPISKDSKLKTARFGADIALISINHEDFNGADQLGFGDKQPFVVTGPGEYEIKGVFIKGFPSESNYGGEKKINTVYTLNLDSINICILGALDSVALTTEAKEAMNEVDILFVPMGGNGVLSPADSYKLALQFSPKVIIPMGADTGDKDSLKVFLKEGGGDAVKPIDKLTIKKKDLEGKEAEIVVLSIS